MYKLLRIAALALPLAGGVAWAQASGTNGSGTGAKVDDSTGTKDTRTATQKRAGAADSALPGDGTKPMGAPDTAPMSDRAGMPDSARTAEPLPDRTIKTNKVKTKSTTWRKDSGDADHPRSSFDAKQNTPSDNQPQPILPSNDLNKDQENSDK
jgi:hypothetical protein